MYSEEEKEPGGDEKHTVVFLLINMEPYKQAEAGAGAAQSLQGALHTAHMPDYG